MGSTKKLSYARLFVILSKMHLREKARCKNIIDLMKGAMLVLSAIISNNPRGISTLSKIAEPSYDCEK